MPLLRVLGVVLAALTAFPASEAVAVSALQFLCNLSVADPCEGPLMTTVGVVLATARHHRVSVPVAKHATVLLSNLAVRETTGRLLATWKGL